MKIDTKNLPAINEKLNNLKSFFSLGEDIIPVIQSLIKFMEETVPLMDKISYSIIDSKSHFPKATDQISNATTATELATSEILDLVDSISEDLNFVMSSLNEICNKSSERNKLYNELLKVLNGNEYAQSLLTKFHNSDNLNTALENIREVLDRVQQNNNNITLSLQVQDITNQQLASVNHLIESIYKRLTSLAVVIDKPGIQTGVKEFETELEEETTFNPDASYLNPSVKQKDANEIFGKLKSKTSQEEIDKLFSK